MTPRYDVTVTLPPLEAAGPLDALSEAGRRLRDDPHLHGATAIVTDRETGERYEYPTPHTEEDR